MRKIIGIGETIRHLGARRLHLQLYDIARACGCTLMFCQ